MISKYWDSLPLQGCYKVLKSGGARYNKGQAKCKYKVYFSLTIPKKLGVHMHPVHPLVTSLSLFHQWNETGPFFPKHLAKKHSNLNQMIPCKFWMKSRQNTKNLIKMLCDILTGKLNDKSQTTRSIFDGESTGSRLRTRKKKRDPDFHYP